MERTRVAGISAMFSGISAYFSGFERALTWGAAHQYGDGFGATLRLHIGLEDVEDLIDDLEQGFAAMRAANLHCAPE